MSTLSFVPASELSLSGLAVAFNHSFEGYAVPVTLSPEGLATRVRVETIDLHRSLVVYQDETLVGVGLLAVRGRRAWCGGFALTPPFRGQGLAAEVWQKLVAGFPGQIELEVLRDNGAAVSFYQRQGLERRRDLLVMELDGGRAECLSEGEPHQLLRHFHRLHAHPAAWQRDLPSLLAMDGLKGVYFGAPDGYALIKDDRLVDLAADGPASAAELCRRLSGRFRVVNEPEGSLFESHGREVTRQFEMALSRAP